MPVTTTSLVAAITIIQALRIAKIMTVILLMITINNTNNDIYLNIRSNVFSISDSNSNSNSNSISIIVIAAV